MTAISKNAEGKRKNKKQEQQQQEEAKNGYWRNELYSLGILESKQRRKALIIEEEQELEKLADIIKQAMFQNIK
jgi:hypothetical protein